MIATQTRRIPLILSVLVVLLITLLLSLALLRFSGSFADTGGSDPNNVTVGPAINPDGLTRGASTDPDGLACGVATDPNGSCQHHANGLLAAGSGMDGNGHS